LLSACDSRDTDKPDISVALQSNKIYVIQNYNTTTFSITLVGKNSQIQNALIDLVYDQNTIGIITNTGSEVLMRTDGNGYASAEVFARKAGTAHITFNVRNWGSSTTETIYVSYPEILTFIAEPNTVVADGQTYSNLTAQIYPPVNYGKCYFFTNGIGDIYADSSSIDSEGFCRNKIKSTETGLSEITAKIKNYMTQTKTVQVNFN